MSVKRHLGLFRAEDVFFRPLDGIVLLHHCSLADVKWRKMNCQEAGQKSCSFGLLF